MNIKGERKRDSSAGRPKEVLELSEVYKSFGGIQALKNVSIKLTKNQITGIIGPNGAGKTTLFNVITGFIRPDKGMIYYNEQSITGLSPAQIARTGVARSFQDVRILEEMSVLENVLLFSPPQSGENMLFALLPCFIMNREDIKKCEKAQEYLEIVQLADKADIKAGDLSYAEQKLLNIARLLAMEGDLILLDEPMSGLDINVVDKMIILLRQLAEQGRTVCIIEHSLDIIRSISDEVIFLDQGCVLYQGTMDKVFDDKKLADLYLGV